MFNKLIKSKTKMKKEDAQKRLDSIENEVKELRKIINDPEVPKEITERVKTIQDAYKELGVKTFGDAYKVLRMDDRKLFADTPIEQCDDPMLNAMLFCRALNEGWWPDMNNTNEVKWYPYFKCSSGFGFEDSNSNIWATYSTVGSRLCFKNEKLSNYAGRAITDTYKKFMM